jgi:hypothetical protein
MYMYTGQYTCTSMFSCFCFQRILRIQNPVYMYIYVFFFLLQRILWIQNPVILCSVFTVFSEANRRKPRCTCILGSVFTVFSEAKRRKHKWTCILGSVFTVFSEAKRRKTVNTEPSIHVHLCFLPSASRTFWKFRTQYTCTFMFSEAKGSKKKKT